MRDQDTKGYRQGAGRLTVALLALLLAAGCGSASDAPPADEPPPTFGAMWADSPDYVVAVRSDGVVVVFDGEQRIEHAFDEPPRHLWGTSRTALYAGGFGVEHRFDGAAWTTRETAFPEELCFLRDTPELALPYGCCGADKIVRREGDAFVVEHVMDKSVHLAGFHGTGADNMYFVGTRVFTDETGDTTGFEPVILRNQGGGWEAVSTPYDLRVELPFTTEIDYNSYLTSPSNVWVRSSGDVFINGGFLSGSVYFDGQQWHLQSWSPSVMMGVPGDGLYGASTGCFMYSCSNSVFTLDEEDNIWRGLYSFEGHIALGLFVLPEGLLVNLCISEPDGFFSEKCGQGIIHYLGRDGTFTMLQ
jgi:hypothetical protein